MEIIIRKIKNNPFTLYFKVLLIMKILNHRFRVILVVASLILVLPTIAMLFTSEVNWTFFDFAVAAVLLYGFGTACEFTLRKFKTLKSRLIICVLLLITLMLIWIELAVGIFGSPVAGN